MIPALIAIALALTSAADVYHLAGTLQGEAGNCYRQGMEAVASVEHNNTRFNAWATPSQTALKVAIWQRWKRGGLFKRRGQFVFSRSDLKIPKVQRLIKGRRVLGVFRCRGGLQLTVFGGYE